MVTACFAALATALTTYDTLRNKGALFVCDVLTVAGKAHVMPACEKEPDEKLPELDNPEVVETPATIDAAPQVVRILEGASESPQRRIFDVTMQNTTDTQIVLDTFELRWRYLPGALSSVAQAAIIEPTVAHSLEMTVDTGDTSERSRTWPVTPTIVVPAASNSEPSIHVFRLELTYAFAGGVQYHPTADWNLSFSLDLTTKPEYRVPVFADELWN